MTAGASLLDLIGERTSRGARPGRPRLRGGLPAPARGRRRATATPASRRCSARSSALFEFAVARAARSRSPCAPSRRRSRSTATRRPARWWRPTPRTGRSWSTRSAPRCAARGIGIQRVLHPIVGVERDADGAHRGGPAPARGLAARVGHALRPRPPAARPSSSPRLEAALRSVLDRRPRHASRTSPRWPTARGGWCQLAGAGAARYPDEEVDETVAFLEWLLQDNFIFLGYREYRIRDDAISVVPGSGLGILADESALDVRQAGAGSTSLPPGVRERALDGRPADRLQDQPALAACTGACGWTTSACARISPDGEIVGEARMLGLFTTKAYAEPASQTPLLHRKLRQILRREDLIEGSHDYKAAVALFDSFPKDELFAALDRRPARRGRRAARAAGRAGAAARPPRPRRAQRLADRRAAALALRRRPARAPARRCSAARFETDAVDHHLVLGEGDRVQVHFTRPRRRRPARPRLPRARARGRGAHAHVGRRAARRARSTRHGRRAGRALATAVGRRASRATTRPRRTAALAVHDIGCFARLRGARRAVRGRAAERARRAASARASALYKTRRQGRAVGGDADARGPRAARDRGGPDAAARRRRRHLGAGLRRARPRRPAARPRGASARASPTASRPSGAATPSRTRSTGSCSRAGLDWRQIEILRAYRKYRQRIGSRFTESYQNDVLVANPALTAKLVRCFELRFDPEHERDEAAEKALREEILADARRGRVARPRPHPAQPARADRRDAAHQRATGAGAAR